MSRVPFDAIMAALSSPPFLKSCANAGRATSGASTRPIAIRLSTVDISLRTTTPELDTLGDSIGKGPIPARSHERMRGQRVSLQYPVGPARQRAQQAEAGQQRTTVGSRAREQPHPATLSNVTIQPTSLYCHLTNINDVRKNLVYIL